MHCQTSSNIRFCCLNSYQIFIVGLSSFYYSIWNLNTIDRLLQKKKNLIAIHRLSASNLFDINCLPSCCSSIAAVISMFYVHNIPLHNSCDLRWILKYLISSPTCTCLTSGLIGVVISVCLSSFFNNQTIFMCLYIFRLMYVSLLSRCSLYWCYNHFTI